MHKYNRQDKRALHTGSKAWRSIRAAVLAEQPLCAMCEVQGLVTAATQVDHLNNDPQDDRRENLAGTCASCHSIKTGQERNGGTFVMKGCDVDGWPYGRV